MKKKTAVIILAFLAVCLCSCSKSKNDSGIDSEYVKTASVVTEESTEETTEVRGADMCPLYMYYEGDLYIPAVNPEDRLIFDTAELKDYKYVGKTTQCSDCSGLTENFRVTILRDNAKVYYDQNEPLDGKPFALMSINENGTVWIAYLKLNDRDEIFHVRRDKRKLVLCPARTLYIHELSEHLRNRRLESLSIFSLYANIH